MTIQIPVSRYGDYSTILGDIENFSGVQREIVAVQELTRGLQNKMVKRTAYTIDTTPAASDQVDLQWADASDWTEIQVNGILQSTDIALPQPTDERIIVMASLQITGTQSHYTSAEVLRHIPTATGPLMLVAEFGAITAGHAAASPVSPLVIPQYLIPGEITVRIDQNVSGAAAAFAWTFHMISAIPGVLSPYFGV